MSEAHVISGIKPAKIETLIPNKVYMMYTRVHTGAPTVVNYLKGLLEKNITLIDYEKIRGDKD